ncbi:MAG: type II secretion system protein [Clostridia bacterium]|nr:type II secretion system protein [Clostridia bacterium]
MRNNKNKGFTLVELLVVIAILAILATVSVVGYTSFIESATVSNDENIAAQLNNFLVAMKADSNGPFYGEEIDENNIREVTDYILQDSGLEELVPQAEKYGYHFYYDLEEDKYVVMKDADVNVSAMNIILNAFADEGPTYEVKLENSFTQGNRYFFVGTPSETSPLSLIVDAFYNFDSTKYTDLDKMVTDLANVGLTDYVKDLVVVTNECNYRLGSDPKYVLFVDGVNMIGTVTKAWNGTDWTPVTGEYVLATLAGKLTIPGSVKFFAEDALNLGAAGTIVINKTAADVAYMSNANFANENVTFNLKDGEFYTLDSGTGENVGKPVITNGTVEYLIQYSNPMVSFDIYVSDANNIRNIYTENGELTNSANIAWELNSFDLLLEAVGEDSTIPATHKEVTWSVVSGTGVTFSGNKATFASTMANVSDTIVIKATSNTDSNVSQTFTINVGKTTAATINFAYKDFAMSSTNNKVTFVYDAEAVDYAVTVKGNVTNNTAGTALTLNNTLAVTLGEGSTGITLTNNTAKVTGAGSGTITVKIGPYLSNTISYEIIDASQFTVKPIKNDILVGNGNTINVSDLFTGTIPSGAELRLYNTPAQDDNFMVPNRTLVPLSTAVGTNGVAMGAVANTITNVAMNSTIKFVGTRTEQVYLAFFVNGTRVSNDLRVTVINGNNVRAWSDIASGINSNTVLLSDIVFPNDAQLTVSGNNDVTFYGNGYTLDVRNAKKDAAEHIISLSNATLDGLNIVGKVYSTFTYQDHYASGKVDSTSIVVSNNGTIKNCYIANGRAPIRVIGDTRVEDSIIFGGKYCNIDVKKGVLTLAGDVTTINQVYEGAVGAGIVCDLTRDTNYVKVGDCNLIQYNFVPKSGGSALPTVSITMSLLGYEATISVKMGTMVTKLLNDTTNYGNWKYDIKNEDDEVTESYLNAGIVYLTATGNWKAAAATALISSDNQSSGSWPNGYEKATYSETYKPGPDILGIEVYANAYVYSPASKDASGNDTAFVNTWFKNAMDSEFMAKYDPSNYVDGAMK